MAVALVFHFSGVTRDQYDAVNGLLNIDSQAGTGDWPAGLLSHAAGFNEQGEFVVMEVWESREAQGRWMQERLGPAIQQSGVTAMPRLEWIDLFAYQTPNRPVSA